MAWIGTDLKDYPTPTRSNHLPNHTNSSYPHSDICSFMPTGGAWYHLQYHKQLTGSPFSDSAFQQAKLPSHLPTPFQT